jgi:hypothetical protein
VAKQLSRPLAKRFPFILLKSIQPIKRSLN